MWLESSTVVPGRHLLGDALARTPAPSAGRARTSARRAPAGRRPPRSAATSATFCRLPLEYARPFLVGSRSKRSSSSSRRLARGSAPRIRSSMSMVSPPDRFGHSATSPGHVGEPAVDRHGVPPRVEAEDGRRTAVDAEQAEQRPDRGRLAGAVRAEEAVHLARRGPRGRARRGPGSPNVFTRPRTSMTLSPVTLRMFPTPSGNLRRWACVPRWSSTGRARGHDDGRTARPGRLHRSRIRRQRAGSWWAGCRRAPRRPHAAKLTLRVTLCADCLVCVARRASGRAGGSRSGTASRTGRSAGPPSKRPPGLSLTVLAPWDGAAGYAPAILPPLRRRAGRHHRTDAIAMTSRGLGLLGRHDGFR